MPIGVITLIVVGILIYFGIAERVLDRLQLSDRAALLLVGAIVLGSLVDIPLAAHPPLSANLGGFVVPVGIAGWLLYKADTARERLRAVLTALVVLVVVYLLNLWMPPEPRFMWAEPHYIYGIAAGLTAYLAGRSRRSAFFGAVVGLSLADIVQWVQNAYAGRDATVALGGAGAFDGTVLAALLAVLLAEIVGETRELAQGGPRGGPGRPEGLRPREPFGEQNEQNDTEGRDERDG